MRFLLSFLLFFGLSNLSFGQLEFSTTQHNFGELLSHSSRYVDINVKNTGQKEVLIFSVRKPKEVSSLIRVKKVAPDSSSTIRLQVNPKNKGPFKYSIQVFTNDRNDATIITLEGIVKEYAQGNNRMFIACPSFQDKPIGRNPKDFILKVITRDEKTKEELSSSEVTFIQKGQEVWTKESNKEGEIREPGTLGLSYFRATHIGYYPKEMGTYINFKRNLVILELNKDTTTVIDDPSELVAVVKPVEENPEVENTAQPEKETMTEVVEQKQSSTIAENHVKSDTLTNTAASFTDLDPEQFDNEHFKPVNVVFILDVSSSMKQADRIELMKYALMQLTEMLREQDQFSIVTYASNTSVILPPTSGIEKDIIQDKIQNLNAAGFTAGGGGIKLGLKTAYQSKIGNGANHVIIITDGAFNRDSDNYKRYIKKYKKKGITFSVVGIKNKPKDQKAMREAANFGNGRFVPIMELSDAKNNLKQEIRLAAFKHE